MDRYKFWATLAIFLNMMINFNGYTKSLYEERIYEPVILRGSILTEFYDVPIDEIFMFAYFRNTNSWQMIPFQIDEMVFADDPFKPGEEGARQDFYFQPDDSLLDFSDELVFMVRDLGDKATEDLWITNPQSRQYPRLEIMLRDPNDNQNCAYGYLYRSQTITDAVPSPYDFSFDANNQKVENQYYAVRMSSKTGLIEDVFIKPPFGSGADIFDTQKLRFVGVLDLGTFTFPIGKHGYPAANERDNLYVYDYLQYTPKPVVRLIREVRQSIRFGTSPIDETAFYVKTKFYPFCGTISGGADLSPEALKREFNTDEDIYVNLELLRQSWDFNEAATGMKFFNQYNQGILIDGLPDLPDRKIDTPIREWAMVTGDQGTMFSFVEFEDASWSDIELYFYDNLQGGQGDGTTIYSGDTGDSVSFGDFGILFQNLNQDSVSLKLDFTAYFLPANLPHSEAETLAYWIKHPVVASSSAQTYSIGVTKNPRDNLPTQWMLFQNHPNPFNHSTKIKFYAPQRSFINIEVIDVTGKIVKTLEHKNFDSGEYTIYWDGTDLYNSQIASGVYFYRLRADHFLSIKKIIYLK